MSRRRAWTVLALVASSFAACVPGPGPCRLDAAQGRVVDRDTGEPIPGALVIEWWRGAGRMGGPQPVYHARFAETDAAGRFAFERAYAPSVRMWTLRTYGPSYGYYHASYGLVRGADGPAAGGEIALAGSLRDSAARFAEIEPLCGGRADDDWERALARAACPLAAHERYASGIARAEGELDALGRRTGVWIFRYEDGRPAARGAYDQGGPAGPWRYWDRTGRPVEPPP